MSGCVNFTWASAVWVLGCFVWLVMAVKIFITLPWTLDEAASIGTAELIGSTCWIFCSEKQHDVERELSLLLNVTVRRRELFKAGTRGHRSTHHTRGTHLSHRCSLCHGHTQSVWGYIVGSGTWTHCCYTYCWTLKHIWWVRTVFIPQEVRCRFMCSFLCLGFYLTISCACLHLPQPALTLSSAPSGQSLSPSHFQRWGTHICDPGHWNASGLQVLVSVTERGYYQNLKSLHIRAVITIRIIMQNRLDAQV